MQRIFFLTLICIICSCRGAYDAHSDWDNLIKGKWLLVSDSLSRGMYIKQNEVVISSPFDTLFVYGYRLKNADFLLIDGNGMRTHNKILKLTKDSLVFEALLKEIKPQKYEALVQSTLPQRYVRR